MSKYSDRQRLSFLDRAAWNGMTDALRIAIDAAIDAHREAHKTDETQCCLNCSLPLVPCECRDRCPGGKCPVCV